jgi:uncharacterized protein (DUF885 family)
VRAIPPLSLGAEDALNQRLLRHQLETEHAVEVHRGWEWTLNPRDNPVVLLGFLPELRPLETDEDASSLLMRYRSMGDLVDGEVASLRIGVARRRFANAESTRRLVEMVRTELAKPTGEWTAVARIAIADGAAIDREALARDAKATLDDSFRPALERYVAFIEDEIRPRARGGDDVGLTGVDGGEAFYEAVIRHQTSLELSAEEIHRIGLDALESIHEEFRELGERALGTRDIPAVFERLRTDPALLFDTAEAIETKAESALAAARDAIPRWFGHLPNAECVVKRIPEHEAPFTTVAYYRPGTPDGSQPGEYRVNVHAPETRPRHEAEVLAFHESIPGHHLQIAIGQELPEMPAFRRYAHFTAYIEGWALYTERLADEMGLYSGDLDRLGMLSFDAWRASRLVVDTGIHAMGWSRERAVEFMAEWTPLARNNIDNEVDRYIVWPGQALSYKIGQIEMWRLRREAEATLGERFDVRAFHDVVLTGGALPLPELRRRVEAWAAAAGTCG